MYKIVIIARLQYRLITLCLKTEERYAACRYSMCTCEFPYFSAVHYSQTTGTKFIIKYYSNFGRYTVATNCYGPTQAQPHLVWPLCTSIFSSQDKCTNVRHVF